MLEEAARVAGIGRLETTILRVGGRLFGGMVGGVDMVNNVLDLEG